MTKYPRQPNNEGGWTISPQYLDKVQETIKLTDGDELPDSVPSWEQIELVLIALEKMNTD